MAETKKRAPRAQPRNLAERLRRAVNEGVDAAEDIHKKVVDLPLDVLERNGVFARRLRALRRRQARAIGAMYDALRDMNQRVARMARKLFEPPARRPRRRRKVAKPQAAGEHPAAA